MGVQREEASIALLRTARDTSNGPRYATDRSVAPPPRNSLRAGVSLLLPPLPLQPSQLGGSRSLPRSPPPVPGGSDRARPPPPRCTPLRCAEAPGVLLRLGAALGGSYVGEDGLNDEFLYSSKRK